MNKVLFLCVCIFVQIVCGNAQTAKNFTVNDCVGESHDLFSELNSGKVIVITWVMPCSACISTARSAYDAVQSYALSNPNKVLYYLADDYANTNCQTLTLWANSNQMPNAIKFSNTAVNPTDYGNVGMPKVVVLGGLSHNVYYNEDNGNNIGGLSSAIDIALKETAIDELAGTNVTFSFNRIENKKAQIVFELKAMSDVQVEVYSVLGQNMKTMLLSKQNAGDHRIEMDLGDLKSGLYIMRLTAGKTIHTVKFSIL